MRKDKLTPFKMCIIDNFPFIEEDFDAITNYQLLCKVVEYLNKVIASENEQNKAIEEIQEFLKTLDLQDEVDNKLDEMAESGELAEIIAQYLQLAGLLCYNTVNDMKNATNLIEGSFCKTFGKVTYNDGYGNFYKIRQLTSHDVVDEDNIVSVNFSQTLIAEKQYDAIITNLVNTTEKKLKDKKIIFIGDSYDAGQSHDTTITKWGEDLAAKLGLTTYYNFYSLGAGFVATGSGGKTFQDVLELNLDEVDNKEEIDYILVGGGYNDAGYSSTYSGMLTKIQDFCDYAKLHFPNAQVLIACFGYNDNLTSDGVSVRTNLYHYVIPAYKHNYTGDNQPIYIKNSEYILHNDAYFSSDYIHPNQSGIDKIVSCLYEWLVSGSINISSPIYNNSTITVDGSNINYWEQMIDENNIKITMQNPEITFSTAKTFTASNTPFKIGTHNSRIIRGSTNTMCALKNLYALLTINNGGSLSNKLINIDLIFSGNGDLLVSWKKLNDGGTWDSIANITKMTIENLNADLIPVYFN